MKAFFVSLAVCFSTIIFIFSSLFFLVILYAKCYQIGIDELLITFIISCISFYVIKKILPHV